MLPEWTMVGFTGHRDLAEPNRIAIQIDLALDRLGELSGPLAAVSSLAVGADLIFLEAVSGRKLPFWVTLPFSLAKLEKDFSAADWLKTKPYLKSALQVEEISGASSDEEAYMEAGESIVDQADVVLALWDGKSAAGLGGTADVVAHARKLEKPLIWINPLTGSVEEERLYHLAPKRKFDGLDKPPKEYAEEYYRELDKNAKRHAPSARHLVQRIIFLHLLASAVGLSAPTFGLWRGPAEYLIGVCEFLVLSIAISLVSAHRRRHEEWMHSRIAAEICRSYLATWQIRRRTGHPFKIAIQEFGKLCKSLRWLQSLDTNPPLDLKDARDNYLEQRIKTQIEYFQERSMASGRANSRLKVTALCCSSVALILTAACVVFSFIGMEGFFAHASRYFSLVLPLASAALFSIILTLEYSRRAARYHEMAVFLQGQVKRLRMVKTWNGLIRIATEAEEQLLQEVWEWHEYSRFAAASH